MISLIKEIPVAFALVIAFATAILLFVLDKAFSKAVVSYGEILEKEFHLNPGEFILKVRDWSGKTIKISCEPIDFNQLEPGDGIQYYCYKGPSGIVHDHKILQKI